MAIINAVFYRTSRTVSINTTLTLLTSDYDYGIDLSNWTVIGGPTDAGLTYVLSNPQTTPGAQYEYTVDLSITGFCTDDGNGDPNQTVSSSKFFSVSYGAYVQEYFVQVMIDQPDIIIPGQSCIFVAGTAISPVQFTASGGESGPFTFSAKDVLPTGLSISSSGLLTGTPTQLANQSYRIKATDSVGNFAYLHQQIVVSSSAQGSLIFYVPNMQGAVGASYSKTITVSGTSVKTVNFTVSGLPAGLSATTIPSYSPTVYSSLRISGTPTTIGTYPVTITGATQETYPVTKTITTNIVIAASVVTAIDDVFNLANRAAETELDVLANDVGSGLTVYSVVAVALGTVRVSGGKLYYTPAQQDAGYTVRISYRIKDNAGTISPYAIATVNVASKQETEDNTPPVYTGSSILVYKNKAFIVGPQTAETVTTTLFPSIPVNYAGSSVLPTISTPPTHGSASFRTEWVSRIGYTAWVFTYTPTTDYLGSDSLVIDGVDILNNGWSLTLSVTVEEAGTLTITPASDITLVVGDSYSGTLFTVQGGASPFRTALTSGIAANVGSVIPPDTSTPFVISATDIRSYGISFSEKGYYIVTLTLVDGSAAPGQTATSSVKFIVYGLDGSAPDPSEDPGDPNNPPPQYTATIQGTLRLDTSSGAFAARTVYLYNYTTGDKVASTTSDGATGAWSFTAVAPGDYFVVGAAQGDDLNVPRDFDALGVITVT